MDILDQERDARMRGHRMTVCLSVCKAVYSVRVILSRFTSKKTTLWLPETPRPPSHPAPFNFLREMFRCMCIRRWTDDQFNLQFSTMGNTHFLVYPMLCGNTSPSTFGIVHFATSEEQSTTTLEKSTWIGVTEIKQLWQST